MNDFPIVALVCSAGGLDALTRVLQPLPGDLPAAVLVLQHLSPEHPSELAAILD
jgi:two-component system chemotaxis response regulator CheB